MEMEEHQKKRVSHVESNKDVHITVKDAGFSWGYRVKED